MCFLLASASTQPHAEVDAAILDIQDELYRLKLPRESLPGPGRLSRGDHRLKGAVFLERCFSFSSFMLARRLGDGKRRQGRVETLLKRHRRVETLVKRRRFIN